MDHQYFDENSNVKILVFQQITFESNNDICIMKIKSVTHKKW